MSRASAFSKIMLDSVAALTGIVFSSAALSGTININLVIGDLDQQHEQNPCIFFNPSCDQAKGFDSAALLMGGAILRHDAQIPVYSDAELLDVLTGGSQQIGIDTNQASGQSAQTFILFALSKLGGAGILDVVSGPLNVPAGGNGISVADYIVTNFSASDSAKKYRPQLASSDAHDRPEDVFSLGGFDAPVPVPGSLALLGSALVGFGMAWRSKSC